MVGMRMYGTRPHKWHLSKEEEPAWKCRHACNVNPGRLGSATHNMTWHTYYKGYLRHRPCNKNVWHYSLSSSQTFSLPQNGFWKGLKLLDIPIIVFANPVTSLKTSKKASPLAASQLADSESDFAASREAAHGFVSTIHHESVDISKRESMLWGFYRRFWDKSPSQCLAFSKTSSNFIDLRFWMDHHTKRKQEEEQPTNIIPCCVVHIEIAWECQ